MEDNAIPYGSGKDRIPLDVMKAFAQTLKRLRIERDLTQHDLVDRSGVSLRMISDMERGMKQPTLSTLIRLARGFDISFMRIVEEFNKDLASDMD